MLLSEEELTALLRGFFLAYMERFDQVAPVEDPPVPLLAQHTLDLVVLNGGRALHFFFTPPAEPVKEVERRVTRLHDVSLWPAGTEDLKRLADESPEQHREQVRRTADIDEPVYVHFVVWPEDGRLDEILREVGERVAEREVKRAAGVEIGQDEPSVIRTAGDDEPKDDWLQPSP